MLRDEKVYRAFDEVVAQFITRPDNTIFINQIEILQNCVDLRAISHLHGFGNNPANRRIIGIISVSSGIRTGYPVVAHEPECNCLFQDGIGLFPDQQVVFVMRLKIEEPAE